MMSDYIRGCRDHGCRVRKPQGMGTNGGCNCDERVLRLALQWERRRAQCAEAALLSCVEAAESQAYPDHGGDEYRRGQHRGATDAAIMVRKTIAAEVPELTLPPPTFKRDGYRGP